MSIRYRVGGCFSRMREWDLVKKLLAVLSILFLALFILFVILFATKSTKSTGLLVAFNAKGSEGDVNKGLKQMFKDAKYTVKSSEIVEVATDQWKGVVVISGDKKEGDVHSKVISQTKTASKYNILVDDMFITTGSSVKQTCAMNDINPLTTTVAPPTSTVAGSTASVATASPTKQPVALCPTASNIDFIFVVDTYWSYTDVENTDKENGIQKVATTAAQLHQSGARVSFVSIGDDEVNLVNPLSSDKTVLDKAVTDLVEIAKNANQSYAKEGLALPDPTTFLPLFKGQFTDSFRMPVIVIVTDRFPGAESKFAMLREQGFYVSGLFSSGVSKLYGSMVSRTIVNNKFKTYKDIDEAMIADAACKLNTLSTSTETMNFAPAVYGGEAAVHNGEMDCLSQDVILVFDETQSIYNNTIEDWKKLSYKFIDQFLMKDDNKDHYSRFAVVVFGGRNTSIITNLTTVNNRDDLKNLIESRVWVFNGLTNVTSAMDAAGSVFDKAEGMAQKRVVIVMSDGMLTADEEKDAVASAERLRDGKNADLWFILAYYNRGDNAYFPKAYALAAQLATSAAHVFNSSKDATTNDAFIQGYKNSYNCPPVRCKVAFLMCENSEDLDTAFNGKGNLLCVQEAAQLAAQIHASNDDITFRFVLYAVETRIYPAEQEDDSYDNFLKWMNVLDNTTYLESLREGHTYLGRAMTTVTNVLDKYYKKNPLVDAALLIGGQFEKGKIDDVDEVPQALALLKTKSSKIYVWDRSDSTQKPDGWDQVTDASKIADFKGNFTIDSQNLDTIGFIDTVKSLDCSKPPFVPCIDSALDLQFIVHWKQMDNLKDQQAMLQEFLEQFVQPYIHMGAFIVEDADAYVMVDMGKEFETVIDSVNGTAPTAPTLNMLQYVEKFEAVSGCGKTSSHGDRPGVDNVIVIVSNDWSIWPTNAYTLITERMIDWKQKDCPNYPRFVFLDLNADGKKYPDGLSLGNNLFRLSDYDLDLRQPIYEINNAVGNICATDITRNCCIQFGCSHFDFTGGNACPKKSDSEEFRRIVIQ